MSDRIKHSHNVSHFMLETIKILRELTLNLTKADDDGCNHSSYFVSSNLYPTLIRIMLIINIKFSPKQMYSMEIIIDEIKSF